MPTIMELPVATQISPSDEIPVSQSGTTRSVSVGTLLASTQPALEVATGTLLGRISLGPGGPDPVAVGTGLALTGEGLAANGADHAGFAPQSILQPTDQAVLSSAGAPKLLPLSMLRGLFSAGPNVSIDVNGVISATPATSNGVASPSGITGLPQVTTINASDLVGISQAGADHAITYQNFLEGQTIDQAQPAIAASDTDTFWTGQGSNVLARQTLAAVWSWVQGHLPGYRLPVVEIAANTLLDGSVHTGRILVCSATVTLTPNFTTMGSGFYCDVINVSGGNVTFDVGITTSSGTGLLPNGQSARLLAASYSGGNLIFAAVAGGGTQAAAAPGTPVGLTIGSTGPNSIALSWAVGIGGSPSAYVIQYRVTGMSTWTQLTGVTNTSTTITGLTPSTGYDVQVGAVNSVGTSAFTSIVTGTTAVAAPGVPTGLVAGASSPTAVPLSWSAPATGGTVSSYTVQYRITGTTSWTQLTGITATSTTVNGLTSSTSYDFEVQALNAAGTSTFSSIATATTSTAAPGMPSGLNIGAITSSSASLSWVSGGGGTPTSYTVQYRITGTNSWTQITGISVTFTTVGGLTPTTQYDFQVQALNASGSSAFTATTNGTTALAAPGVPMGLTIGTTTSNTVQLSWEAGSGNAVASYTVQYRITGSTNWTQVLGVANASYTAIGLTPSTSYDFQVAGVNAGGASAFTSTVTGTTSAPSFSVTITWNAAPGSSYVHGTSGIVINAHADPSPHGLGFAFSASSTIAPAVTSLSAAANFTSDIWGQYMTAPSTAGTYYLWAVATDSSNNVIGELVSTAITVT